MEELSSTDEPMHLNIHTTAENVLSASSANEGARLKSLLSDYTPVRPASFSSVSSMEEEQLDLLDAVLEHLQGSAARDNFMDRNARTTAEALLQQLCRSTQAGS